MSDIQVAVIAGSASDEEIYGKVTSTLDELGITYEMKILSAHRNPDELREYVTSTPAIVFIAVAGLSAALPGVIASMTAKPVIGVPVSAKLGGLDALLSIVQMPPGVPVACVGIDNGKNAAYLAKRILDLIN
ncbi:MAG TPA: 5-(carboxyamino)imidazole ribonucleotide mutase [Candidatus Lokiarchaeia archaeon]|nr:5-(carboxyamino)imidazole ribonucleotide mutase [Candidatus Lokiarchaeia archaeon]